jgi:hypothetical protein
MLKKQNGCPEAAVRFDSAKIQLNRLSEEAVSMAVLKWKIRFPCRSV